MKLSVQQLAAALDGVSQSIGQAQNSLETSIFGGQDWAEESAEWYVQLAFMQLRLIAESLELPELRREIQASVDGMKGDLLSTERTPDGDLYLKALSIVRQFREAIQSVYVLESSQAVTRDLEGILREATYAITDSRAFGAPPANEDDVHRRIESILRCVFPDLKHKPQISKPIKNFQPDTGIPSIGTLIEYKFIASADAAVAIVDEILADTRGYTSAEWRSFVYVIYETKRFRPEAQWRQLLRECEAAVNTSVVVLTGNPPEKGKRRAATTKKSVT